MVSQSNDEAEILALIHANRIAFWTRDFEAYEKCFVHAGHTTRWHASPIDGIFVRQGWDEIAVRVRQLFTDQSFGNSAFAYETTVENLQVRIAGDLAWATFRQRYSGGHERYFEPDLTYEARFFEKHDGQWRIVFLGCLEVAMRRPGSAILRLAADGTVEWQSPEAVAALAADDDLVIRGGRLRIRDSRADQRLQAAIHWASTLVATLIPSRGALPIVLGSGEGLPTKVWWIIAYSGLILFSLGDKHFDEQRLKAAAVVYGLSPAQKQVAMHIVGGLSLGEIASQMKITQNTARTHLDRIFQKTGVHTKPALVRVLLSTAAPI